MHRRTPVSASTRRIAILAPMRIELRPLVAPLGLAPSRERESEFLLGAAGRVEVVAAITGIGMRAGAQSAARILDAASPDHLIVVGIAGGIGGNVAVGDLIVPELVSNLDTGKTFRPTALGDPPQRGTLASSDALLGVPEEAERLKDQGVVAIDMETAAIAAVCDLRGCPWSVFRAISDRADDGATDAAILGLVGPNGNPNLAAVARFVLTQPHRIPQLVRLGRGAKTATRTAAGHAVAAIESLRRSGFAG
jgi:nucleoside phosphorylase